MPTPNANPHCWASPTPIPAVDPPSDEPSPPPTPTPLPDPKANPPRHSPSANSPRWSSLRLDLPSVIPPCWTSKPVPHTGVPTASYPRWTSSMLAFSLCQPPALDSLILDLLMPDPTAAPPPHTHIPHFPQRSPLMLCWTAHPQPWSPRTGPIKHPRADERQHGDTDSDADPRPAPPHSFIRSPS